ncbi:hypothetical protein BJAS_P4376 [Bathymodiolus japonicus methanotrophic gill symbiont]|uniref:hypothetical protein n=1 Tax=Bathymodiolus japonicus methanotrophic gill symbiont TaxID=113269 RepID=UPI001B4907B9|nr:hypothetical protein [Bathymodiolus japonicus methanotrophic gill symbiont]GFO73532.1 hypothetical protein BJAS_P4376 [Bathymodiolus japonicus methanotrophic gill symbiont]
MTPLSDKDLYSAITYARNLNETEGQKILTDFHIEQPALAGTIFNIFSSIIDENNKDMGAYFMDLCFDSLCVYSYSFGKANPQTEEWIIAKMSEIETGMIAIKKNKTALPQLEIVQRKFYDVLKDSIADYANGHPARIPYIEMTQNIMLASLNLLESLYEKEQGTIH